MIIIFKYFLQANITLSSYEVKPKLNVSVSVASKPLSYIGLLAVDQSVLLLKSGNDIDKASVSDELKQYLYTTEYNYDYSEYETYDYNYYYNDIYNANLFVLRYMEPQYGTYTYYSSSTTDTYTPSTSEGTPQSSTAETSSTTEYTGTPSDSSSTQGSPYSYTTTNSGTPSESSSQFSTQSSSSGTPSESESSSSFQGGTSSFAFQSSPQSSNGGATFPSAFGSSSAFSESPSGSDGGFNPDLIMTRKIFPETWLFESLDR